MTTEHIPAPGRFKGEALNWVRQDRVNVSADLYGTAEQHALVFLNAGNGSCHFSFGMTADGARGLAATLLEAAKAADALEGVVDAEVAPDRLQHAEALAKKHGALADTHDADGNERDQWGFTVEQLAELIGEVRQPADWKLVPIEPTDEQCDAGLAAWDGELAPGETPLDTSYIKREYKAMVDAAPEYRP